MKKEESLSAVIRKYVLGKSTREGLQKAVSFLKDPKQDQEIEKILAEIWNDDQSNIPLQNENRNLTAVLKRIHKVIEPEIEGIRKRRIRRMAISSARIAAILIVGVFLGISIPRLGKTDPVIFSFMAPRGSISQMILPDSTMVYLNSGSELKYSHDGSDRREVFLDGEAWFQVAENTKIPFVVHTGYYDIEVTGTEFNVNAYRKDNEIVTTLVKGSVVIPSTDLFRINSDIILAPGQQLVYDRNKQEIETSHVETKYYTSWMDNKLVFINMSLEDLVTLLERKYGVDIMVTDRSLLSYHYDGTIKNESILEIMELLKVTLPIRYEVVDQTIEITKK